MADLTMEQFDKLLDRMRGYPPPKYIVACPKCGKNTYAWGEERDAPCMHCRFRFHVKEVSDD